MRDHAARSVRASVDAKGQIRRTHRQGETPVITKANRFVFGRFRHGHILNDTHGCAASQTHKAHKRAHRERHSIKCEKPWSNVLGGVRRPPPPHAIHGSPPAWGARTEWPSCSSRRVKLLGGATAEPVVSVVVERVQCVPRPEKNSLPCSLTTAVTLSAST